MNSTQVVETRNRVATSDGAGPSETPTPVVWLIVFQALAAAAGLIAGLKTIFEDATGHIDAQLNEVLTDLQQLRRLLITGTAAILEAIDGVRRQIDENTALDAISLADRAFFSDLAVFDDKQTAMGESFEAADRLARENDVVFASSFIYVVNLRLAILKDFDPYYFCSSQFRQEFQGYLDRLNAWIDHVDSLIRESNRAEVVDREEVGGRGYVTQEYWLGTYTKNGVVVNTFRGSNHDLSEATRRSIERETNAARDAGVEADRQQYGVVDMRKTATAWEQAFQNALRNEIVTQVLNRPVTAIDSNPDGMMVDGRIIPSHLNARDTLREVLNSQEFRNRIREAWEAFIGQGDDRLVQLAYRRLFERAATEDEVGLLRQIAETYGYGALVAALLHSKEYIERYADGLPKNPEPGFESLQSAQPKVASN